MDKTPFSVYDFFAYLASGAMIVVSVDYLFGEQLVLRPTLSPQVYLLLVIASYIVGQVVSHLSAVVLEQWLVKRLLGGSTGMLLAGEHGRSPWAKLFPQYFLVRRLRRGAGDGPAKRRGLQVDRGMSSTTIATRL